MTVTYKWQAVSSNKTGGRDKTDWYDTAADAKREFFTQFPKRKACNITAARPERGMMIYVWGDPFIRNVTKATEISA